MRKASSRSLRAALDDGTCGRGSLYKALKERSPDATIEFAAVHGTGGAFRAQALERLRETEERCFPGAGSDSGGSVYASEHTARQFGLAERRARVSQLGLAVPPVSDSRVL